MALRVLDGNQTATTLSSVVTGGEHIVAHSVVSLGANAIANITSAVSGSVVSISNFPSTQTIAGTVTASLSESLLYPDGATGLTKGIAVGFLENQIAQPAQFTIPNTDGSRPFPVAIVLNDDAEYANGVGNGVNSKFLPISGTVTANLPLGNSFVFLVNGDNDTVVGSSNPIPVTGSVSVGNISADGGQTFEGFLSVKVDPDYYQVGLDRITPEVTVTNLVNTGFFTTRFGTPTTANTVFATSAVTNGQRKYLLIQNVTTGSNVITVGIGFTPTTTQGIQLTAGAGITFESSYIPIGAVYVLSSVTASNFTILEA